MAVIPPIRDESLVHSHEESKKVGRKQFELPENSSFVQGVAKMFNSTGIHDMAEIKKAATALYESVCQRFADQIKEEAKRSREKRKEEMRRVRGED